MLLIATRLASIFLMISAGWGARRLGFVDDDSTRGMSRLLTTFFYPALIFTSITGNFNLEALRTDWVLPAGTLCIMLGGFLVGLAVERFVTDPHSREGHAFLFQCTMNNYVFLPMPLILFLWGERGVALLILSTLGSETALWTLGAYAMSGRHLSMRSLKHLVKPPLITIVVSLVFVIVRDLVPMGVASIPAAGVLQETGRMLHDTLTIYGGATIPAATIIAGSRMAGLRLHHLRPAIHGAVLVLRLLILPALFAVGILLAPLPREARGILLVIAFMPSSLASIILSEIFDGDSEFAATSVLITHVGALVTLPIWLALFLDV